MFKGELELWSNCYGRWLMFKRLWVRTSAMYTGWTFFTLICWKNCIVCLIRPKINKKEARVGPFKKTCLGKYRQQVSSLCKITDWVIPLFWNKTLWLDVESHVARFNPPECIISKYSSYSLIKFWYVITS